MGMKLAKRAGSSGRRGSNLISEINVTPLVDVMLVLLIIFMITSPLLLSGVNVDLPETNAKPVQGQEEPLSVTLTKNGDLYIMETKIELSGLSDKLKEILKEKYDSRIFVRGDKEVSYGRMMEIVGEINRAGYTKVALISNMKQNEK